MHRLRYITVALVALLVAVALPATAMGQSAGEDQYTDPLAGEGGSNSGGSGGGGGGGGNAPAQPAQQTPAADATPAATPEPEAEPAQAENADELPRTGLEVWPIVAAGGAMLLAGFAMRRSLIV